MLRGGGGGEGGGEGEDDDEELKRGSQKKDLEMKGLPRNEKENERRAPVAFFIKYVSAFFTASLSFIFQFSALPPLESPPSPLCYFPSLSHSPVLPFPIDPFRPQATHSTLSSSPRRQPPTRLDKRVEEPTGKRSASH